MTHTKYAGIARRCYNKCTILLVASILLTLMMSKPASSLLMVEYRLPLAAGGVDARPRDIAVLSDSVVFTEQAGARIGSIPLPVSPDPIITEAILPPDPTVGTAEPWGIVGSGSNIYYTDFRRNRIGSTVTGFGVITEWVIPTGSSGPRGIAIDGPGNLWFVEALANKIGTLNPTTNQFKEWELQNSGSTPNDIIVVGDMVYFTEYGSDRIGVFDRIQALNSLNPTLMIKEFRLQSGSKPWSLVVDDEGMIWFTCSGRNVIGVLNPSTGHVTEHRSIPTDNSEPRGIAFDTIRGEVWFTEYAGHRIAKYVPGENLFYEYPTNTGGSSPNDIALVGRASPPTGPIDVWFTEYGANCIGEIVQGDPIDSYGTTSTSTVTTVTSAVSASFTAASSSTTRNVASVAAATSPVATQISASTISGTNTISSIRSDTAYRLSTSTYGTTTSFIVEVVYTSATSTEVSTSYITTTSVTSSTTATSTSTSYIATTSVTSTSTSTVNVNTETVDRTSTTALSIPNTLSTTITQTKYLTTVSGSTSTTSTSTLQLSSTQTSLTTIPTTVSGTTTSSRTTTTYTIPPFPELPFAIPGYPIESIIVGIGLAATFLVILSKRKRGQS